MEIAGGENMGKNQPEIIRQRLKSLHDRGVFSSLSETSARGDKFVFRFQWLLGREFVLEVNTKKQQLVMRDLLPTVEYRSFIDRDLRGWVAQKNSTKSDGHSCMDACKADVFYANRKQSVSLFLSVQNNKSQGQELNDGLKLMFGLVNELFTRIGLQHTDYLHQQLGFPEE